MKPPLSKCKLLLELHPESLRSDYFHAMFLESSPLLSSPQLSDRTSGFQGSDYIAAAPFSKQVREESYLLLQRRLFFTWRDGGDKAGEEVKCSALSPLSTRVFHTIAPLSHGLSTAQQRPAAGEPCKEAAVAAREKVGTVAWKQRLLAPRRLLTA